MNLLQLMVGAFLSAMTMLALGNAFAQFTSSSEQLASKVGAQRSLDTYIRNLSYAVRRRSLVPNSLEVFTNAESPVKECKSGGPSAPCGRLLIKQTLREESGESTREVDYQSHDLGGATCFRLCNDGRDLEVDFNVPYWERGKYTRALIRHVSIPMDEHAENIEILAPSNEM